MKKIIMTMFMMAAGFAAYGDVSAIIGPTGNDLTDSSGTAVSMTDGFFMLIADTSGDGLDGYNFGGVADLNLTDTFAQDDDKVIYSGSFWWDGYADGPQDQQTFTGVTAGQKYYAVWSDGTGWAGVHSVVGDVNWAIPTSGGSVGPAFNGFGDVNTQYAAVPEPATALLAFIGGGLAWASRRMKRFHNYES